MARTVVPPETIALSLLGTAGPCRKLSVNGLSSRACRKEDNSSLRRLKVLEFSPQAWPFGLQLPEEPFRAMVASAYGLMLLAPRTPII